MSVHASGRAPVSPGCVQAVAHRGGLSCGSCEAPLVEGAEPLPPSLILCPRCAELNETPDPGPARADDARGTFLS